MPHQLESRLLGGLVAVPAGVVARGQGWWDGKGRLECDASRMVCTRLARARALAVPVPYDATVECRDGGVEAADVEVDKSM